MLEFFRKYQRSFFIFISIMTIASFSFFGTFGTFSKGPEGRQEEREEVVISHAIDGSNIHLSQVVLLSKFLLSDREDSLQARGYPPNFMNDGVIRYDFLRTGLAELLVESYFDALQPDLKTRLMKAKKYKPYAHGEVPLLCAKTVWERFAPAINRELAALQVESEVSMETFSHLVRLYLEQTTFQPEMLRRVLAYQHQQYPWLNMDPSLSYEDFSLFGYHSVSDWFGRDFVDLISQFILNAAIAAEQKGYRVSLEEAKGDLQHRFLQSMQKLAEVRAKPDLSFSKHLRMLGFDEKSAAECWQKVLLFRRYFQEVGAAMFVDQLALREFSDYAHETAVIDLYEWPKELQFRDLGDIFAFEYYLNAVSNKEKGDLTMPTEFLGLDEIEPKDLVRTTYRAKIGEVSKNQIGLRATLREVWDWQLDENNWNSLRNQFSYLPNGQTREERFQILEKLDSAQRVPVDAWSRTHLVDLHPEWIEGALRGVKLTDRTFDISAVRVHLPHVDNQEQFSAALSAGTLGIYSDDGMNYLRFENLEKIAERHVLNFVEAKPMIEEYVNQYLDAEYAKVRTKTPKHFQTKDGEWRSFHEVKDEIGRLVYAEVFKALDLLENRTGPKTDAYYTSHRLLPATRAFYDALRENRIDVREELSGNPLAEQFRLLPKRLEIPRISEDNWMKKQAFTMMPKQWSPIETSGNGQIAFFYMDEKIKKEEPILEQIAFGKETLAADAQRFLAEKILTLAKKNRSLVIPLQKEIQ